MTHPWLLSPKAVDDLEEILDYIAEESGSHAIALSWLEKLESAFGRLAGTPTLGRRRIELTGDKYRWWPVGRYLIIYDPAPTPIRVLRVVHSARQLERIVYDDRPI